MATAVVSAALFLPRVWDFAAPQPGVAATPAPAPAAAPAPPAPTLDQLLTQYAAETDPDDAFNKLFALWSLRYVAGSTDPCTQAMQAGLECLTQRGSLAQLRLFNRPALLNVIDEAGRGHQLVLAGLDEEHALVDIGGAQREIGIGDLSSSWFGDYVLLWRPAAGASQPLALGARDARVRWLRDSLRRVNGLPAEQPGSDRFDASLVTLVEDFQRRSRLAVDGIAGVQTQVALDAALNDASTPFLRGSGS
jgi:general secretion pathway protein A